VKPVTTDLRLVAPIDQTFETSVRGGEGATFSWQLDGRPAGRGQKFRLRSTDVKPGSHRLEVVATRGAERKVLHSWRIDIEPEPLRFAALEPKEKTLDQTVGSSVGFRAPLASDAPDGLSWVWEVNGKRAEDARGSSYRFAAADPGRYVVRVRAVAPGGLSIDNSWTVTVRRPALPTPEPPKIDANAELLRWIDAYCRAFERRDTDTLLALGHIASRTEADRLREALSTMRDLRLTCSNPAVRIAGDEATVSFDRTDRWIDPRGQPMERALPRITKTLRRANGRWVATP
jgi:hypothetical protein